MTTNIENNPNPNTNPTEVKHTGLASKIIVGGVLAGGLCGLWYQGNQLSEARADSARAQQATQVEMAKLNDQVEANLATNRTQLDETIARLNAQVEKARKDAQSGTQHATTVAKQQANEVLNALSTKNQELLHQVDQLKQESDQKAAKVDETLVGIKGDVGTVKTDLTTTQSDVASTKTELASTIADLHRATGDMGVMSGLIATNATELQALRKLGEKEYVAFNLPKKAGTQRVGDIQLRLKKADTKRNKFTVEVMADDKTVEKKDKGLNEPVQFYAGGQRLPYEVVVNEIRKDAIVGYLAVPRVKVIAQR